MRLASLPSLLPLLIALVLGLVPLACDGDGPIGGGGGGDGEICGDGIDNDNDGAIDEGADEDGDTYRTCDIPELIDCDDTDSGVNPAADEACDGNDTDCDGLVDNVDLDGDGYVSEDCYGQDCDDNDPDAYPLRPESCDGADNDCDGVVDNGYDADNDGWSSCLGDCDNSDPQINPDATELCDGVDNNCDGNLDEAFDHDNDGYVGYEHPECADLYSPGGDLSSQGDCDDNDDGQWPGAHEDSTNGEDDDCDQCTDECQDADGDGWDTCDPGAGGDPTCEVPGENLPDDGLDADCDDCNNPDMIECLFAELTHPDTIFEVLNQQTGEYVQMDELCNGQDDDCDGEIDEGYDPKTCDPLE